MTFLLSHHSLKRCHLFYPRAPFTGSGLCCRPDIDRCLGFELVVDVRRHEPLPFPSQLCDPARWWSACAPRCQRRVAAHWHTRGFQRRVCICARRGRLGQARCSALRPCPIGFRPLRAAQSGYRGLVRRAAGRRRAASSHRGCGCGCGTGVCCDTDAGTCTGLVLVWISRSSARAVRFRTGVHFWQCARSCPRPDLQLQHRACSGRTGCGCRTDLHFRRRRRRGRGRIRFRWYCRCRFHSRWCCWCSDGSDGRRASVPGRNTRARALGVGARFV